jgi:transposase
MRKKIVKKAGKYFTQEDQHLIIQEMITNGLTKREIWKKYTGQEEEHGQLLRWMKKLGYSVTGKVNRVKLVNKENIMATRKLKIAQKNGAEESFENLQLKRRIFELEKQLKDAELKAIAFSTMVDIAEKEFKIPIRKKLNTKP